MAGIYVYLWRIYGSHLGGGSQLQEPGREHTADEKSTVNLSALGRISNPEIWQQEWNIVRDVKYSSGEIFCSVCPHYPPLCVCLSPPLLSHSYTLTALSSLCPPSVSSRLSISLGAAGEELRISLVSFHTKRSPGQSQEKKKLAVLKE